MDKELKDYINKEIKSKYKSFDKAHNISHFNFVTKNCLEYGKELIAKGIKIDLDIAYIVGAYHDIGLIKGRENHATYSSEFVLSDKMLAKYYDAKTIKMIADAVKDHSSHLSYEPRNIYGKLVADADRNNTCYLVFSRPLKYNIENFKGLTKYEHIEQTYEFVKAKFGRNGYVKYYLNLESSKKEQQQVFYLIDNPTLAKAYLEGIYDEFTKNKKSPR
jgi:uncharacterized protein